VDGRLPLARGGEQRVPWKVPPRQTRAVDGEATAGPGMWGHVPDQQMVLQGREREQPELRPMQGSRTSSNRVSGTRAKRVLHRAGGGSHQGAQQMQPTPPEGT